MNHVSNFYILLEKGVAEYSDSLIELTLQKSSVYQKYQLET